MLKIDSTEFIKNLDISLRDIENEYNLIDDRFLMLKQLILQAEKEGWQHMSINTLKAFIK